MINEVAQGAGGDQQDFYRWQTGRSGKNGTISPVAGTAIEAPGPLAHHGDRGHFGVEPGAIGLGFFGSASVSEANAAMFGPPAKIDGKRAFAYLEKICEIGPRTAGSAANKRQLEMVEAHFKEMGAEVRRQPFGLNHPQTGQRLALANLIGSWHPERAERVVIGAHYDTRPHPDQEEDPQRHALPFIGANDGASGVALLMEFAHHLKDLDTRFGVDLVLFDGEELVYGNDPDTRQGEYFLGSKEFARRYAEQSGASGQ